MPKRYTLNSKRRNKGFTLIELLIVITIIAILAAIVFVAIDPSKRFSEARNSQRRSEVNSIVNAVLQYAVDHDGDYPANIDSDTDSSQVLGTNSSGCDSGCTNANGGSTVAACVDLSGYLVDTYLGSIPEDPKTGSPGFTDYYINKTATGRIVVGACDPELGETIEVTR